MRTAKHAKPAPHRDGGAGSLAAKATVPARDVASGPAIIASAFARLDLERRARLLGRLLGSVGPLALAVVGGGAFAKYLRNARWPEIPISLEDAAHATSSQVHELVRYVEQSNPHLVDALLAALLQDGMIVTMLGASVAAVAIKRLSGHRRWKQESSIEK
ncbi:MAG TPA: hypothetical protein VH704_15465 [Casimicrobiaceae bacterium]|nr:hypothetical protein [Casimicrobiaceae bacterium]